MAANPSTTTNTAADQSAGLLRGRRAIAAARARGASSSESDGGGTGRSDGND